MYEGNEFQGLLENSPEGLFFFFFWHRRANKKAVLLSRQDLGTKGLDIIYSHKEETLLLISFTSHVKLK